MKTHKHDYRRNRNSHLIDQYYIPPQGIRYYIQNKEVTKDEYTKFCIKLDNKDLHHRRGVVFGT